MTIATTFAEDDIAVEDWLQAHLLSSDPSQASRAVVDAAIGDPEYASYASAAQIAQIAGVNVGTVTRAAQALGFSGWPELRQEIRARYLGHMSAAEIADAHQATMTGQPLDDTIQRNLHNLRDLQKTLNRNAVTQIAKSVAKARRTIIIASGSYAGVAHTLAHNARIAGYDVNLVSDSATLVNTIPSLGREDVVVAISFWRLYRETVLAAQRSAIQGATVCAITDSAANPLAKTAEHTLVVGAEGTAFFPSMASAMVAAELICSELARVDPERSRTALAAAEQHWEHFELLLLNSRR